MRIGLISDTHMPQRWKQLPEAIFTAFANIDLILHAGDVGELWVLDELSQLAPVVAVHGNDETQEATAALPYLQSLSIAGHRLVLTHAHYPIRAEELASRTNDWESKFERRANFAKEHGASICVFGHTHIPMNLQYEGIQLINPGAIASGNPWSIQLIQTVAILTLEKAATPLVEHIDLATGLTHQPFFDSAGFNETFIPYNKVVYEESILPHLQWLWWELGALSTDVKTKILELSFRVWEGQQQVVTREDLRTALLTIKHSAIQEEVAKHPLFAG